MKEMGRYKRHWKEKKEGSIINLMEEPNNNYSVLLKKGS